MTFEPESAKIVKKKILEPALLPKILGKWVLSSEKCGKKEKHDKNPNCIPVEDFRREILKKAEKIFGERLFVDHKILSLTQGDLK